VSLAVDPRHPSTAIGRALASIPDEIRLKRGERREVKPEKPPREPAQGGLFGDDGAPY
jgi:hypothetical protein